MTTMFGTPGLHDADEEARRRRQILARVRRVNAVRDLAMLTVGGYFTALGGILRAILGMLGHPRPRENRPG